MGSDKIIKTSPSGFSRRTAKVFSPITTIRSTLVHHRVRVTFTPSVARYVTSIVIHTRTIGCIATTHAYILFSNNYFALVPTCTTSP